jgi:hypothetical protein
MLFLRLVSLSLLGLPDLLEGRPLETKGFSGNPTVNLGYSQYEGTALSAGVNQFLGIRYAAPPVGNLRFRAPQDPLRQDGVQDAKEVRILFGRDTILCNCSSES